MTQPYLTAFINGVFRRKISVDLLRHVFITDRVLANVPALAELESVAADMGNSTAQQMLYKKLDA